MNDGESLPQYTFWQHVEELRKRLFYSCLAVFVSASFAFIQSSKIMNFILDPFLSSFGNQSLIGVSPAEAFTLRIMLSLWFGAIIASPVLVYQAWKFVEPGLYFKEKKVIKGVSFYAFFLFVLGISFAYYILLPFTLKFFYVQYQTLGLNPTIRASDYLKLVVQLTLACGIVFMLPIATYIFTTLGILTSTFLKQNFRISVIVIFILSAVLTPPDVLTQILLAFPLILLYVIGICTSMLAERSNEN
ncbi:MAG: twin-arginine translocase subunit TatC [Deltaproteobacteria bacterium]|nr:twin-arginine translocase subunit TatC [Deltaproteobacteria bacterium]